MDKSDLQENILRLYLRLNGFFTTGFIIHSPDPARNKAEIDTLAVRFPFNREPERQRGSDRWLELSDKHIELAICEAKTVIRFNESLYSDQSAIRTLLSWAGMFSDADLSALVPEVQSILVPESQPAPKIRRTAPRTNIVVRSIILCPEKAAPRHNQSWFVGSDAIFPFIFECLSPIHQPPTCGRKYDSSHFGHRRLRKSGGSPNVPGDL